MRGRIETMSLHSWGDLQTLGCTEWLWIDTDDAGVHLTHELPSTEPAQVTHVWGWSERMAVRVRIDVDLPHATERETGLVGAVLHWDTSGVSGDVAIDAERHPVWPPRGGRSDMRQVAGLNDTEQAELVSMTCTLAEKSPTGDVVVRRAVFLCR